MAEIVTDFFLITGLDSVPPDTMAELIPYLLSVLVGVALVSGAFRVIGSILTLLLDGMRWR